MKPELSPAEQVETMLRIRNTKAKTAVKVKDPDTDEEKVRLVAYQPNDEGFYFDNHRRKWVLGIDPAGNIVPLMISTCRDPFSPNVQEAMHMRAREKKGWLWLERAPYGCPPEKWETERVRIITERRATHQANARKEAPNQMETMAAIVHQEIRPIIQKLAADAQSALKTDREKDSP